ncbi:MAG: hypothetical protein FWD13_05675 [Treponema sp.]|nr:hypothetical protein [Treponema sp.]
MAEPSERKKQYHKRRRAGLCPRCGGKVKKSSPFKTCDTCREYYRNYQSSITEVIQETRRQKYAERKAKHLCPRCGIFVGKKSKNIICDKCLKKQYNYNYGQKKR